MSDGIQSVTRRQFYPLSQALLAALLFGASAPLSKILLGNIEPIPLAGFLYLGAGVGLVAFRLVQVFSKQETGTEAAIKKDDLKWLAGSIIAGGVAAPIVLLFSLRATSGATASLLLNFEGVATGLLAALVFKEAISRRAWWAMFLITTASILLSTKPGDHLSLSAGALGVLTACVLWGIDNNLTFKISAKDPFMIVTIKGLTAGCFSLILAMSLSTRVPDAGTVLKAMVLGGLSYGLSIVLFVQAMRGLGAARTSTLFGTAPLAGMILSFAFLGDKFNATLGAALALMVVGAFLMANEKHSHSHIHDAVLHEHSHVHHDGHHEHEHARGGAMTGAHSHAHDHRPIEHDHHHMPEIHHRHVHKSER